LISSLSSEALQDILRASNFQEVIRAGYDRLLDAPSVWALEKDMLHRLGVEQANCTVPVELQSLLGKICLDRYDVVSDPTKQTSYSRRCSLLNLDPRITLSREPG